MVGMADRVLTSQLMTGTNTLTAVGETLDHQPMVI